MVQSARGFAVDATGRRLMRYSGWGFGTMLLGLALLELLGSVCEALSHSGDGCESFLPFDA